MKQPPRQGAPWLFGHSIRTRLLLWTIGVTGLILIAVVTWNYLTTRDQLQAQARERAAFLAEASAAKIDARLGPLQGLVHGMALTLQAQALALPFAQVRALQDAALRDYPEIYGTAVALLPALKPAAWPDAAPYAYRDQDALGYQNLDEGNRSYLGEDWFALAKGLDRGVWSEPYRWSTGVKMVTYSVPIRVQASTGALFAGVVTCDIDLEWLDRMLADLRLGELGYGLLMTHNGTYIAHPVKEIVLTESVFSIAEARGSASLRQTGQRMVSGRPGLIDWVSWANGEPAWLAWQPLKTADWTMGTVIFQAQLRAEILRLSRNEALVGAAGLVLLVLAVWLVARSITRPVGALSVAAATLAAGDLNAALPAPRGRDEIAQLTAAFGAMRDSLNRYMADLAETTAARERIGAELRIAHEIQMDLVPKTFPVIPARSDMDLFALMEPAREVGGDFYDFFFLDHDRLVVAIADVSGKGMPAALFMAVTRSFFRSAFKADADPGRALARVSDDLSEGNESCMFVTLFCAVIHLAGGRVDFANAGHNAPLLVRAHGRTEWIATPHGTAAAIVPGARYESGRLTLAAGDTLLLYTDGVTEAMDGEHRLYGEERLAALMLRSSDLTCRECLNALAGDLLAHAAGAQQSDDITMLMFRRLAIRAEHASWDEDACLRLEIPNHLEGLASALERLDGFLASVEAAPTLPYVARLVLEELVTNIIKYGYPDAGVHCIRVVLRVGPPATMTIEDDGQAFNPLLDAPTPDLEAVTEARAIGGLGLHMVKTMAGSLAYRREGGVNRLDIVLG
ncbi:SpoIIE family protein phosphatase [uncultured Thiodictyon sp.]|uniref:SpoIIE family protein phosphatase n=1 Tax=uncultured Thiodictyon sp. TaxID=1846217 RepID=UPI0025F28504|nr:SpoIIE family protein phosphatase [uncultured Thiodictyon sp.]